MAGISAGLEDAWAVMNNPAGMARYSYFSLVSGIEQRFLMKELGQYSFAITYPVDKGCLGFSAAFSGYSSFIDQKLCISYGRLFGKNFLSGLSLVYTFQKAGDDSRAIHQVSYEIGAIVLLSQKISFAFTAFNPFQLYYHSGSYASLPSIIEMGLSFRYSPSLMIHLELEKDLDLPPLVKIGIEYIFNDLVALRGGIKGFPASYSFGAAFRNRQFLFEIASCYHQYLGFTPGITFQYDLQ
jgi:hypothetical protein